MTESWTNWSGDVKCQPGQLLSPSRDEEVLAVVKAARRDSSTVRIYGTGHSSMPLVTTDGGYLLDLNRLQGVVKTDADALEATVMAGTKIWQLGDPLLEDGLAMINMGDIDRQSIAGAMGTATHGTGPTLKNVSNAMRGARIVTGRGEIVEIHEETHPDEIRALRVSIGALGVVTQVRMKVTKAFRLRERIWRQPIEECLGALDSHIANNRSFEFFWFPRDDFAEMKTLNVVEPGAEDAGRVPFAASVTRGGEGPHEVKEGEREGWSAHIIPSIRDNRFHEMEYAIPAEAGPECFRRIRERMKERHTDVAWPIEYRTVHPDDAYLSPHYGRPTVTLSIHQDARKPFREFFDDIEPIFWDYDGRSHWGKVNNLKRERLRELYPEWDTFAAIRERFDPDGVMLNPYLRELFAP